METNNLNKRISLPAITASVKAKTPENDRLSFSIADGESEMFPGNGPP